MVSESVLYIPQSFRTGASPSDGSVLYPGHSLGEGSYSSAEMQLVYSTALADWAAQILRLFSITIFWVS